MAVSAVEICNMALSKLAINQYIESLLDPSTEAKVCSLHYNHYRKIVLTHVTWGFAERRIALGESGTAPDEWEFQYGWPSGALRIIQIPDGLQVRRADQRIPFRTRNVAGTRYIVTDYENAEADYTDDVEDTTLFSPQFDEALAARMAYQMAMPLSAEPELRSAAWQDWIIAVSDAVRLEFAGKQNPEEPDAAHIAARE